MKVTKLDKRHTGTRNFSHFVTPDSGPAITLVQQTNTLLENRELFFKWCNWCQEQWGNGCERDWAYNLVNFRGYDIKWAWYTDDRAVGFKPRLYFKEESMLTAFVLKWG